MSNNLVFTIITSGFLALSIFWVYKIITSYLWIKEARKITHFIRDKKIFVIIPVLNEAKRITKTIEYFRNTFSHLTMLKIVIVTTEAEFNNNNNLEHSENTIKVVRNLAKLHPNVVHHHYPSSDGKMAHQLNYAIRNIISKNHVKDFLLAIYNADSRPHPKTFDWVLGYMAAHKEVKVFQQYGNYSQNIHIFKKWKSILWSAACWQNRWSIGFELPHALNQFEEKKCFPTFSDPMNYCIGHGLFFKKEVFQRLGGFAEDTHNEDAIFGLELSYLKEPIIPVPYFDISNTPDTLYGLYIQKSNWFFGPLEAFKYVNKIIEKRNGNVNKLKLMVLASKLFLHAVYWIAGPTLMLMALILTLIDFSFEKMVIFFLLLVLFLSITNFLSWLIFSDTESRTIKIGLISFWHNLIGSFPCYLLHGLSAYRTLIRVIVFKITNKTIQKERTPMKR